MSTCKPKTVGELQLYKVLQRANLLQYFDTFISQGGDDVAQLCEAGEEEFLEIMSLVGMASKPLHVRRLQKALQEWVTKPKLFKSININYRPAQSQPLPPSSLHLYGDSSLAQDSVFESLATNSSNRNSVRQSCSAPPAQRLIKSPKNARGSDLFNSGETLHGLTSKSHRQNVEVSPDFKRRREESPNLQPTREEIDKVANRLQAFGEHALALALQLDEKDSILRETRKYVDTLNLKYKNQYPNPSVKEIALNLAFGDCRYLMKHEELFVVASKLANNFPPSDGSSEHVEENSFLNQEKTLEIEKRLKTINVQREAFERKVILAPNPAHAAEYQAELSRLTQEKFNLLQRKSELQRNFASSVLPERNLHPIGIFSTELAEIAKAHDLSLSSSNGDLADRTSSKPENVPETAVNVKEEIRQSSDADRFPANLSSPSHPSRKRSHDNNPEEASKFAKNQE